MPKPKKQQKLFPLFCKKPKASTAANADIIEVSDGSSDEDDDLPLTCLLDSQNKPPPTRKNHSNLSKQKKGKKRHASTVARNSDIAKSKNPCTAEKKKQKQAKLSSGLGIQSNDKETPIVNGTVVVEKKQALSFKDNSTNESKSNGKDSGRIKNGDDIGFPAETAGTAGNVTHENKSTNQQRQGRLFSDSSMDFVPPYQPQSELNQQHAKEIRNIVHKLNRRLTHGGCLSQHPHKRHFSPSSKARIIQNKRSSISSSYYLPKKWKIPSWISLEQPGTDISDSKQIDLIRWDPMGVLLAVAIDRTIIIYDWDMLRAADLQGRRDRVRGCHESEFKIPPIVKFRLPHPVASLVWNPFDMDELAVGFRVSGETRIYNVSRVARWLSKDPSRNHQRLPPQSTYIKIMLQRVTGTVGDILFLDHQNVLVSVERILFRWQLSLPDNHRGRQQRVPATSGVLVWRYQSPSPVTSMALMGSNLVLIGTNRGHMYLIDWTKRTKVSLSFSHEHRPKVLQSWVPHDRLKAANEDSSLRNRMGIMKMRVETTNQECMLGKRHWGRCRVKWVTQSGWLLSMMLDSVKIPDNCHVHYSSPEVVFKNADGSLINTERKSWSIPYNATGIDLSTQVPACLVGTPTVTKILSHHDKFVLDSQPSTVVSSEKVLVVYGTDDEVHSIPFPGAVKDRPQALAVHPSLEWIVVGERKRLHIMVNSARTKTKT